MTLNPNGDVMSEDEADEAHRISEAFQALIVSIGATLIKDLSPAQQEYVLGKAHDEFRFWRIEDELT